MKREIRFTRFIGTSVKAPNSNSSTSLRVTSIDCLANQNNFAIFQFSNLSMNTIQKIAQCFSPAAFIHDTEENYQAIEKLILEQEIGGLTFFHSRHSAAANFEKSAGCERNAGEDDRIDQSLSSYFKNSFTDKYRRGIWLGDAHRKNSSISFCNYPRSD